MTEEESYQERGNSLRKDNKKILIVDDDETILHLLRKFFFERGFHVLTARDGFVAMERLKAENPDLVLTDLNMRRLSGGDLIKRIRQRTKDISIFIMTAYPYLYPEKHSEDEVQHYFVKPFDINELFCSIQKTLGG